MWVLKHVWVLLFTMNCECFVNLIQDQGLTVTARMSKSPLHIGLGASNAIDGDAGDRRPCTAMDVSGGYKSVWWKVWLQRTFNVAELKIYFQPATIYRSTGFSIYVYDDESYNPPSNVSGSLVYQHDPSTGCPPNITTIIVNRTTQGIGFYNTRQRAINSTCKPGDPDKKVVEICEVNVLGCDATRYSQGCSHECDRRCLNQHCDAYNGECIYGCSEPHRSGPYCADCKDGYYGENCTQECGHCIDKQYCDTTTGVCLKGCLPHWNEPKCDECGIGFYGENCTQICGQCVDINDCNNITGVCRSGCQLHWDGSKCDVCADGYYGDNCSLRCCHCKYNMSCNHDGLCPLSCSNTGHWQYPKCQGCVDGFHGSRCNKRCGYCMDKTECNKTTGHCVSGCKGNWMEPKCQVCADGYYGKRCTEICGKCKDGSTCDKSNGSCNFGCKDHWMPQKCQVCIPYKYGPNCAFACGHCKDGWPCSTDNGSCINGCEEGWRGISCLTVSHDSSTLGLAKYEKGSSSGLYIAIIAVTSTLLVISVLVNVILVFRKQRRQSSTQHVNNQPEQTHTEMEETREYDKIGVRDTDNYQELSPTVTDQSPQDRASAYINLS